MNISFDLTPAFDALFMGLDVAFSWVSTHRIAIVIGENSFSVSFLQLIMSILLIGIFLRVLPVWGDVAFRGFGEGENEDE